MTNVSGTLFYGDGIGNLCKTDGTSASVLAGFLAYPAELTAANGAVVLSAGTHSGGVEPWQSDGTNTSQIGDVNPNQNSSNPGPFDYVGGKLIFAADDGTHGRELYSAPLQGPTAVAVTGFTAQRAGASVVLRWRAESSVGLAGFNVFRRTGARLNRSLIPATGRSHVFRDLQAPHGASYRLEEVFLDGSQRWFSAASAP